MKKIDQLINALNDLVVTQKEHTAAINALAESNRQLVDVLLADSEQEDMPSSCYLDGTPL